MPIAHLSYAIGLATASALIGMGLSSDSIATRPRPVIAYLGYWTADTDRAYASFLEAIKRKQPHLLREASFEYVTGPDDDEEALAEVIRAAARRKPAVLVAPTGDSALAASRVAGDTPVVFSSYIDPVRSGLVQSMRAPGSHITGISLADWLDGKRLEILREAAPHVRSVAILADRSWAHNYDGEARIAAEAARYGLSATILYVQSEVEVESVMTSPAADKYDAWYVPPTYIAYRVEAKIISHINRLGKPGIFGTTEEVRRGGLMAYSQDTSFVWNTLADLVSRVYAGEDPGSIPVERPRRYVLSVRTGPGTESTPIASSVVRRADRIF